MPIWKTYNLTEGQFISETFPVTRFFDLGANPAPPAWFEFTSGFLGNYTGYSLTAQSVSTTTIYFTELVGGEIITWRIIINTIPEKQKLYENCCDKQRNLVWLNIQGGWQNYIFTGVKTIEVKLGSDSTFKTNELVKKLSQRKEVYNGEIITTGDIPKSHVDILDSLQYSIQAFLLNEETNLWDIPIIVDSNSFTKYKSNDKLFEVKIRFIYAEEILIQTQ